MAKQYDALLAGPLPAPPVNPLDASLARLENAFPADLQAGLSTNGCDCPAHDPEGWFGVAEKPADPVDHPAHYNGFSRGSEVIDITEHLNFCRGNAVKYLARAGRKDAATELEDLRKARWYVDREITRLEAGQ